MHIIPDVRSPHRAAVQASVDVVAAVTRGDLRRPTPCAGWNLLDLLCHMTVQHQGFAAAARGGGDSPIVWAPERVAAAVAADPAGTYAAAAADVLDAFAVDGVLDAAFALPDFGPGASFPGAVAIGFHFVDYVVHGWDVARSIGVQFALPGDVLAAALPLVLVIPDGDYRTMDGAPFGPAVVAPAGATDLDRILGHLGRTPGWRP
ncbi:TIGR03086 family metal-binding protein [Mycobacterium sp. E3198]|uniref:TIGR03086 family metal-binding protein n=1 Tax=Mycobacterium sp. E3198 TaxID=1834143 RepID=UPI0007FD2956|nr:TIGR03086 family metal-binding protein [Mycobacterium sp. E3198]OBG29215.1 TIGR03086 family protein [Mycobacterium sp. E3198]